MCDFQRATEHDAAALYEAFRREDFPEVARASHRIRGASSIVGMIGLAGACKSVEDASRRGDAHAVGTEINRLGRELLRTNNYISNLTVMSPVASGAY
jgi:HPt (histidine-containing phosphotransfer) domain-containing protein